MDMQSTKRGTYTEISRGILVVLMLITRPVYSEDLDDQQKALNLISDFADRICTKIPLEGRGTEVNLSGKAKAELNRVLKQIFDLGIEGAGEYKSETYQGLLQSELAKSVASSDNCRLSVFEKLNDKLLPSRGSWGALTEPDFFLSPPEAAAVAEEVITHMLRGSVHRLSVPFCDMGTSYSDLNEFQAKISRFPPGPMTVSSTGVHLVENYMSREAFNRAKTTIPCRISDRDYAVEIRVNFLNSQQVGTFWLIIDSKTGLAKVIWI